MSYKPEVLADNSGVWSGNALRFATKEESDRYVADLAKRWVLVRDTRTVESDDPVNAKIEDDRLVMLESLAERRAKAKGDGITP